MKYVWLDYIDDSGYHAECYELEEFRDMAFLDMEYVTIKLRDTPRLPSKVDLTVPFPDYLPDLP